MNASISFSPLLEWAIIGGVAGIVGALLFLAAWLGLRGWFLRGLVGVLLLGALANPSYREEDRTPLADIVFVVIDETASQTLPAREAQMAAAQPKIMDALQRDVEDPVEIITVKVLDSDESSDVRGTILLRALRDAMSSAPPSRIAGAIVLTDGRIHDLSPPPDFPAPVHLLLTGRAQDWDRRIVLVDAPAFGIVGEEVSLTLRVEDSGAVPPNPGPAKIIAAIDGGEETEFVIPIGEDVTFGLTIEHAGINLMDIRTPQISDEITDRNNRIIHEVNGVRDRLRVLLVSGEPYAGERTWRNLLKADDAVDLVHFTILRSPDDLDGVPVDELSLIAFPTRELFMDKIDEFDLIIFDRYRRRGVLPDLYLENITRYVRDGGAILVAAGPAFATVESLARSPLVQVLPGLPTGGVVEQGYLPLVSDIGRQHPVTATLGGNWGRWFRQIDLKPRSGHVVMEGVDGKPLLILDRVEEGRIALLASDHAWLWSRGIEGGGPQQELLRRLAHWLMKEPELEEEVLRASANGHDVHVERRSLTQADGDVLFTSPSGVQGAMALLSSGAGVWSADFTAGENGIYRIANGDLETVVAVGPARPREFDQPIGVSEALMEFSQDTGGGQFALARATPDIRRTREGRVAKGRGWLGLPKREAYTIDDIRLTPLAPGWLVLLLAALLSLVAWRVEGR